MIVLFVLKLFLTQIFFFYFVSGFGAQNEHDLLQSIKIPFVDPKTQFFENGFDGFPTFGMKPGSDIKTPYRLSLPERLYSDFSLIMAAKPASREGGVLFAVVNPLDTIVQLGVRLSPGNSPAAMTISLIYTDVNMHFSSQTIASFSVPSFARKWARFSLRVKGDNITLFFNCREHGTAVVQRKPKELIFDSASTLYIGQAGPIIKGEYDVSIYNICFLLLL